MDQYLGMTCHYVDEKFNVQKVMVACTPAEGRHSAINVGAHIDKAVGRIAGLGSSTTRFCVTDNAANMLAAVPKHTKKVDVGLGCMDHLINLVVEATNKAVPEIDAAIKECKDLSSRTHFAPVDQQRIRRECHLLQNDSANPLSVKFRKIITPVKTRWNSTLMMIKSIAQLRQALESIKEERFEETDKSDAKLKAAIPSAASFDIIDLIIPILEKWQMASEILSGDEKPTLHQVN
jgi:hypothetical protein